MAYAKAIETLQEVETRLIVPPLEMPAKSDEPALSALADDAGGATQAADEHADASDPEPEPPLAAPTVAAEEPAEGTERYVGMDVVFASEPPSEAPPVGGDPRQPSSEPPPSSDPVPETELAMPPPARRAPSTPAPGAATQEAATVLGGELARAREDEATDLEGSIDDAEGADAGDAAPEEADMEDAATEDDEADAADAAEDAAEDEENAAEDEEDAAEEEEDAAEDEERAAFPENVEEAEDEKETEEDSEKENEEDEGKEDEDGDADEKDASQPPFTEMQTGGVSESEVAAVPMSFLEGH